MIDAKALHKAAKKYEADMVRFARDLVAIPSFSCQEGPLVRRIALTTWTMPDKLRHSVTSGQLHIDVQHHTRAHMRRVSVPKYCIRATISWPG